MAVGLSKHATGEELLRQKFGIDAATSLLQQAGDKKPAVAAAYVLREASDPWPLPPYAPVCINAHLS